MVLTYCRVHSLVAVGSAVSEASTQTDLLRVKVVLQASGCRDCPGPLHKVEADSHLFCSRCVVVDVLCHQDMELWEEVSRLLNIYEDEQEIEKTFLETLQLQKSHLLHCSGDADGLSVPHET